MDDRPPFDPADSPEEAIARLVALLPDAATTRTSERIALRDALGRTLAEPAVADRDSPPFDSSAMDGYAIRIADLQGGRTLAVLGESRPGEVPPSMPSERGCIRVATGAARPEGADAVVRREDVSERSEASTGEVVEVTLEEGVVPAVGAHWRVRGENARRGDSLVGAGTPIDAGVAALLASIGVVEPLVLTRVSVGVVTTGEEVVPIDSIPAPHRIRNSNGVAIATLLGAWPWIRIGRVAHVADRLEDLDAVLASTIEDHDAVVLTGGISMGHRDLVRSAVEARGARIAFHRVRQRPGRPMLGAVANPERGPVALFGLPGNPLSAMVTARRIVVPTIATIAGARPPRPQPVAVDGSAGTAPIWRFLPARRTSEDRVELVEVRSSGDVVAAARSDGVVEIPPDRSIAPGDRYPFLAWNR